MTELLLMVVLLVSGQEQQQEELEQEVPGLDEVPAAWLALHWQSEAGETGAGPTSCRP